MRSIIDLVWAFFRWLAQGKSWSARLFRFTGVLFLLQLFPLTGVFLMLVAAPFWSVVTINLGFVALAVEAALGRTSRLWLLAPLAWILGYAAYAAATQERYKALDAELRKANAEQTIAFDPTLQSLVVQSEADDLSGLAIRAVRDYGLPVTYEARRNEKRQPFAAYRLAGKAECDELREDRRLGFSGISASWFHDGNGSQRTLVKDLCLLHLPEAPVLPQVLVQSSSAKGEDWLLPHSLTRITILDPLGRTLRLTTGQASVLGWIPMPAMGCALNSGAPSWQCFAGFMRDEIGLGGEGAYGGAAQEAVIEALGLTKVSPSERRATAGVARAALDGAIEERIAGDLAVLDEVLAHGKKRIIIHDVSGLLARPDRALSRGADIAGAIARAVAADQPMFETARVLQSLLTRFPAQDFARLAAPLVPVLMPHVEKRDWVVADDFAPRLGDLGAPAVPLIETLAIGHPKRPSASAIYGLCRAGAAATPVAERLVTATRPEGEKARVDDTVETAVFVTLQRFGRHDLVERETAAGRFSRIRETVKLRAVTPESPTSVCSNENGWPSFPD